MRRKTVRAIDTVTGVLLTIGAISYIVYILIGRQGFDYGYVQRSYGIFLEAAKLSVYATTISFLVGMLIGFLVGWVRTAKVVPLARILGDRRKIRAEASASGVFDRFALAGVITASGAKHLFRRIADGYVETIRGTPLVLQIVFAWSIFLVYYHPPGYEWIAGIVAMTANTGAYQSEIFRGGLQTVHTGQVEAGRALGLSRWGAMRHVILPQALRLVIPPLTNEYIGLFKASSLLFAIGIQELSYVGKNQAFVSGHVFEVFALVTAIYFLVTVPVSKIIEYVERRYRIPGLGIQARPSRL